MHIHYLHLCDTVQIFYLLFSLFVKMYQFALIYLVFLNIYLLMVL